MAEKNLVCDGCEMPIEEGEHFMDVDFELKTKTRRDFRPVRNVQATTLTAQVHGPGCLVIWMERHPILRDVFGR